MHRALQLPAQMLLGRRRSTDSSFLGKGLLGLHSVHISMGGFSLFAGRTLTERLGLWRPLPNDQACSQLLGL